MPFLARAPTDPDCALKKLLIWWSSGYSRQLSDVKCSHDLKVMSLNPAQVKLGVRSTTKSYLNHKYNIYNLAYNVQLTFGAPTCKIK